MDGVSIRPARRDDVAAVLALWAQARSPAASTPDDVESVTRLLEHDDGALLLAELDGRVVGALIAGWDGWRGNMYRLAVLPAHRRRGVGRRLVEAGHERLRSQGAHRVTALVDDSEEDAVALWRALGYRRDAGLGRYITNLPSS
jgi:ribosomal protein S18 acetylase RimI-like enzyme